MTSIRLFLSQAAINNWELRQLDIPSAFLNGTLKTDVYIEPPKGVKMKTDRNYIKAKKGLVWSERITESVGTVTLELVDAL
ncbi:unnamed protein product [Arctia plantaginis]|uniref:Reverse transcriptase Ty1/copia-type domain-containing protein n=1 Tax=Arctia plantaginis TaxID=874455 RepID=A0A8S1A816_ARCPL|nr:unnamed protein product [Arctia plantaginis]